MSLDSVFISNDIIFNWIFGYYISIYIYIFPIISFSIEYDIFEYYISMCISNMISLNIIYGGMILESNIFNEIYYVIFMFSL